MTDQQMTAAERRELAGLARKRAKLAKDNVDVLAAQRLAEFERDIAATYEFGDAAWADVTRAADEAVRAADAEVARICEANGIPSDFRPKLNLGWYGRGENAIPSRVAELRRVAKTKIDAAAKGAKSQIETSSVEIQTELLAAGLTSAAAQQFLTSMPTPADLLPTLDVVGIEKARQLETDGDRRLSLAPRGPRA